MTSTTKPEFIAVDVETTGLDWTTDRLHGVGISIEEGHAEYFLADRIPDWVREHLKDPTIPKIGHNLHAFDAKFLHKAGIEIQGEFDDTMVLWNLCGEETLGLKYLSDKYIGQESLDKKRRLDRYLSANGCRHVGELCARDLLDSERPHTGIIGEYCVEDVLNTVSLYYKAKVKLQDIGKYLKSMGFDKTPLDYYAEEARPLERVLFEIELRGIRVDLSQVAAVRDKCLTRLKDYERRLSLVFRNRISVVEDRLVEVERAKVTTDAAKAKRVKGQGKCQFLWSNPNHVARLLYEACDLPEDLIQRTRKGRYQTDKLAIESIIDGLPADSRLPELLRLYLKYKLEQKILSTYTGDDDKGLVSRIRYIDGVPRIFPTYRQTTGTGRLACSNPNMQNLKRNAEVKRFFIPDNDDDVFDDFDYSQIELRTAAHLSKDEGLVEGYRTKSDLHIKTGSRLFNRQITKQDDVERQAGKKTNFLTIFDGKEYRLQAELKKETGRDFTLEECQEFIRIWFETYPGVRKYLDNELAFFKKHLFVYCPTGRIRRLPDIRYGKFLQEYDTVSGKRFKFTGSGSIRTGLIRELAASGQETTDYAVTKLALKKYNHAIKSGYNAPIQGLAASMTKRGMIRVHRQGVRIVNQVHDSLLTQRRRSDLETQRRVIEAMRTSYPLDVPVEVDVKTLTSFHPADVADRQEAA